MSRNILARLKRKIIFALKRGNKKHFCRCCLQFFSSEKLLTKHKEVSLNGKQTAKLRSGSIKFKNYQKQLVALLKTYVDFECNVKKAKSSDKSSDRGDNASYTEKCQSHIPCSLSYKLVCIDDKVNKQIVLNRGKKVVYKFTKKILEEYDYCKKVIKKHFNKNLVTSTEEEERFQLSNKCWICDNLFDVIRHHCHVTRKYRGSANWSCNVNLKLTKKVSLIFDNSRGYDSY